MLSPTVAEIVLACTNQVLLNKELNNNPFRAETINQLRSTFSCCLDKLSILNTSVSAVEICNGHFLQLYDTL